MSFQKSATISRERAQIAGVTIVMPCLNEAASLPHCIANAREALARMKAQYGLAGEIVVADNGSADGSDEIAARLGARVVVAAERGYGAALIAGCRAAKGRFILMGDADGSYDFTDGVAMVGKLREGANLCMGSRFKGGIKPGAMPWKNRYIGNPLLTGALNLFFRAGVDDAHCGLRALTKSCFDRLNLCGSGMEFASEMVVKAALLGERIAEAPATLHPDLRGRAPHLRPWRDGWRHLRYLLMLCPTWLFVAPSVVAILVALAVLVAAGAALFLLPQWTDFTFGNYWVILAGSLLRLGHIGLIMALACHVYGVRAGFRRAGWGTRILARWVSLETMVVMGVLASATGAAILIAIASYWWGHHLARIGSVLPPVIGTTFLALGLQSILGGFLLAVIGGNEAQFLRFATPRTGKPPLQPISAQPEAAAAE